MNKPSKAWAIYFTATAVAYTVISVTLLAAEADFFALGAWILGVVVALRIEAAVASIRRYSAERAMWKLRTGGRIGGDR